jgi:hypothetical protein
LSEHLNGLVHNLIKCYYYVSTPPHVMHPDDEISYHNSAAWKCETRGDTAYTDTYSLSTLHTHLLLLLLALSVMTPSALLVLCCTSDHSSATRHALKPSVPCAGQMACAVRPVTAHQCPNRGTTIPNRCVSAISVCHVTLRP